MRTRKKIVLTISLISLLGVAYFFWQHYTPEETKPRYRTASIDVGTITQQVSANGTLNPVTVVNVGTQVSGTVHKLYADFNQKIKAGQILMELDPSLFQAAIKQSEANLQNSRAQLKNTETTLLRNQNLVKQGFISAATLDQSAKDVETAKAQVDSAKAMLERDQINLKNSIIRSPINGVIIDKQVDIGQTVAASFQTPTLFKIAQDLAAMQIDTNVAEADVGSIQIGQKARFTVDAFSDREFEGTVHQIRINPSIQQNVVTYNVVIYVHNDQELLLPGMTARVAIIVNQKDQVLRLPNAALRFKPSKDETPPAEKLHKTDSAGEAKTVRNPGALNRAKPSEDKAANNRLKVYKLAPNQNLIPVNVQVGISDGRYTEILKGDLKPEDEVVIRENNSANNPSGQGPNNFRVRLF